MSSLRQALADYLTVRRALGYKLERAEKLLAQFITYIENIGEEHLRTEVALTWATMPKGAHRSWWSSRLSLVRGFAAHLRTLDPATEVPPADLQPSHRCRATPYLYSEEDVAALTKATATLPTLHQAATCQTLIGLLAVTGMRVGEAIALDRGDVDFMNGLLIVRHGKFGKSRELPLHPSAVHALRDYLSRRDRPHSAANTPALFVSSAGTRLCYCNVRCTFRLLVHRAGLQSRSASCRPRLHDLRHTFAIRTILDAYQDGVNATARLPLLSTYLGHVDPSNTYWYLSAAPELLALAGSRLERYIGGDA